MRHEDGRRLLYSRCLLVKHLPLDNVRPPVMAVSAMSREITPLFIIRNINKYLQSFYGFIPRYGVVDKLIISYS